MRAPNGTDGVRGILRPELEREGVSEVGPHRGPYGWSTVGITEGLGAGPDSPPTSSRAAPAMAVISQQAWLVCFCPLGSVPGSHTPCPDPSSQSWALQANALPDRLLSVGSVAGRGRQSPRWDWGPGFGCPDSGVVLSAMRLPRAWALRLKSRLNRDQWGQQWTVTCREGAWRDAPGHSLLPQVVLPHLPSSDTQLSPH